MGIKSKETLEYPRHWWFSCSGFTCYIQTDEDNRITPGSTGIARRYVGETAKRFNKIMQRKFGGCMTDEYTKDGCAL